MTSCDSSVTTLGLAHRNYGDLPFGSRQPDRLMHCYVLGQTGTGKSTLLANMVLQDTAAGRGLCLIDPHGDLARDLAQRLGSRALFWEVADPISTLGYNPLTRTSPQLRPLVASGLIETLKKQWPDAWGVRMEHLLRQALLALLDQPRADLRDILQLFLDRSFRQAALIHVADEQVRQFWTQEYPAMNYKTAADGFAPIANKLGAFLAHPVVRRALCEPEEPIRFRALMDEGRILLVSLSKGQLGAEIADVLGGLLTSSLVHAAFTRTSIEQSVRRPFFLYIDEFHSFTTETIADLLSETRKYGLGLILAQQHMQQTSDAVLSSILGNCGTMIAFRVGASDAGKVASQLGLSDRTPLITQPNHRAHVRLMIDGAPSRAFSMTTLPLPTLPQIVPRTAGC